MAIWHKYPNTNFHELDADWMIGQFKEFQATIEEFTQRVIDMEDDVQDLKDRMLAAEGDIDSLEGRMHDAEGDITALQGRVGDTEDDIGTLKNRMDAAEGDIGTIEDCLLMNSTQVEDVGLISKSTTKVTIPLTSVQYEKGAYKAGGTVDIELEEATELAAGVLGAGDKAILNLMAKTASGVVGFQDGAISDVVDDTKNNWIVNVGYLNTPVETTIMNGDMYNPTITPGAAVVVSNFSQNTAGTLKHVKIGGIQGFYFDCTNAEIYTTQNDGTDIIEFTIPEACRPSKRYSWSYPCIDENDNWLGIIRYLYNTNGTLIVTYFGNAQAPLTGSTVLDISGHFLPFM